MFALLVVELLGGLIVLALLAEFNMLPELLAELNALLVLPAFPLLELPILAAVASQEPVAAVLLPGSASPLKTGSLNEPLSGPPGGLSTPLPSLRISWLRLEAGCEVGSSGVCRT
jgi:hypothetical protein